LPDSTVSPTTGGTASGFAPAPFGANPRFPCFDAMRAVGMVMVIATHTHFQTIATKKPEFAGPILWRMDFGVTLFFMLSGFLLYRPFALAACADRPQTATATFLRRRVLRVFPGYWLALTVVWIFFGLPIDNVFDAAVFYSLLTPFVTALQFDPQNTIDQAWSLTAEFIFYIGLPFYALALARLGARHDVAGRLRVALLGAGALYLAGNLFRAYIVFADPSWQRQGPRLLPGWIDIVAIGMAMAAISAAHQSGHPLPRIIRWFGDHPGWTWTLGWSLFLVITRIHFPDKPNVLNAEYVVRYFGYGVIGLLLLLPAMFGDQDRGVIRAVLRSRVLVLLGTVSLGVYLIHHSILIELWENIGGALTVYGPQGNFLVLGGLTFAASVAYAFVSYYAVESPFLRLKERTRRVKESST
jgi:peptidoglycan/LPS O-acetylase OafA/YrhL